MASNTIHIDSIDEVTRARMAKSAKRMMAHGMRPSDVGTLADFITVIFDAGRSVLFDVLAEMSETTVDAVASDRQKVTPAKSYEPPADRKLSDDVTKEKVDRWIRGEPVPVKSASAAPETQKPLPTEPSGIAVKIDNAFKNSSVTPRMYHSSVSSFTSTPHLDAVEPMKEAKKEEPEPTFRDDFEVLSRSPELMKRCGGPCGRKLPLSMFHKSRAQKDGLTHMCKDCVAESNKKRINRMGLTTLPTIANLVKLGLPVGRPDMFTDENSWDLTRIYDTLGGKGRACKNTINSMMVELTKQNLMGRVSNKKAHSHYYWIEPHTLEALVKADVVGKERLDENTISKIRSYIKQAENPEVQAC